MQTCFTKPLSRKNLIRPHQGLNQKPGSCCKATSPLSIPDHCFSLHVAGLLFLLSTELSPLSVTQTTWPLENGSRWPPCPPVTAPATLQVSVFLSPNPQFPEQRLHLPSLVQCRPARKQAVCVNSAPSNALLGGRGVAGGKGQYCEPKGACL